MNDAVLWYLDRATGVVALVLLTLAFVLGVLVRRRVRLPGLPRSGTLALHRSVTLLSVLLLLTHVGTAVLDSSVDIGRPAVAVPLVSGHDPLAVGLGALALDLLVLVVVTSLLRGRLPVGLWRAVHLTAYAMWPLALVHGLTAGSDLGGGWLLVLVLGCAVAVAAASAAAVSARRVVPAVERAPAAVTAATTSLRTGTPVAVSRNG